jgi:hypothetical protein
MNEQIRPDHLERAAYVYVRPSSLHQGHANISQTDTYLNAGRIVLQASIGFDAFRGKSVANEPTTENRPPSHKDTDASSKDLLH